MIQRAAASPQKIRRTQGADFIPHKSVSKCCYAEGKATKKEKREIPVWRRGKNQGEKTSHLATGTNKMKGVKR
jgi:hypothetical protein